MTSAARQLRPAPRQAQLRLATGILCGTCAALIWAGGAVVSRHLVTHHLSPLELTLLRYLGCLPVALTALLWCRSETWRGLSASRILILILLAGPLYQLVVVSGYLYAGAGSGTLLITGLLPIFSLLLAISRGGCGPGRRYLLAIATITTGLILLWQASQHHGSSASNPAWQAWLLFSVAALAWASLNHLVETWQVDSFGLSVILGLTAPLLLPALFMMENLNLRFDAPAADFLIQIAYHGVLVPFLATSLFFAAVKHAGAQLAAALQALSPALAVTLGVVVLNEQLTLWTAIAAAILLSGILAATSAASRTPARS